MAKPSFRGLARVFIGGLNGCCNSPGGHGLAQQEVVSEITGKIWKVEGKVGQSVEADDPIVIIESMKMEIPVLAPAAGKITEIRVGEGDDVEDGQVVAIVEEA